MGRIVMQGITRRFGPVVANDAVDFDLAVGEIHGLVGENGSGKTTLMSILYGLVSPDAGSIEIDGAAVTLRSPSQALAAGIAMIPQRFMLVPTLSVAENVAFGIDAAGRSHARLLREVRARLRELGETYGLDVSPDAVVESLSMGQRQRVEILRALYHDAAVLLMDEPTSVLTPGEVDGLLRMVERMVRDEHRTVVFVTHKLREVLGFADRITVLRQGRRVERYDAQEVTLERLVSAMMGTREVATGDRAARDRNAAADTREPVLVVKQLSLLPRSGDTLVSQSLHEISLSVVAGEILGIAGVEGNGQQELELALAGLLDPDSGEILLCGNPGIARDRIAYVPSDGQRWGVIRDLSVTENLLLHELARGPSLGPSRLGSERSREVVASKISRYQIQPPYPGLRARQLSGGNAQKVLLARELGRQPDLVVAAQPTMGLDVASAVFVREELVRAAAGGAAVVMISSDLDELLECCDRIAVMFRGRIQGQWQREDAAVEVLGAAMAGMDRDRAPEPA